MKKFLNIYSIKKNFNTKHTNPKVRHRQAHDMKKETTSTPL